MTRRASTLACGGALAVVTAVCLLPAASTVEPEPKYLSPTALAPDPTGKVLYVAEAGADRIAVVDLATGKVTRNWGLPGPPSGLAVSSDGSLLYVTCAQPEGLVCKLDPATGKVLQRIAVGHTPISPVLSPDGRTLYVCNRFNNTVGVCDLRLGKQVARIPVLREPVATTITPDGRALFVANHLPAGRADQDYAASAVSMIDTASRKVTTIRLPNGSSSMRGSCVSPDGKHVYATHILARYQLPTTQLERGWMNTNALSVIDAVAGKLINTVLLDNVDRGAANPWGVAVSPDNKQILVTHAGTHELSVIDRAALHEKLARAAAGEKVTEVTSSAEDVPNDLSFVVGLRRRVALAGRGPRAVAVVGTTAYVAEYFSDSLTRVDLEADDRRNAGAIALGPKQPESAVREGERLFNDADLCFQQWQSCASCHPDARTDALNWDLLNDGLGNPKNTRSMLLAHKTPPAMSLAVRDKAETAVRAGIRFIQFAVRPEDDARAIDAYLTSLAPVPSPYLADGKFGAAARRGETLFKSAGCAPCHPGKLYTDLTAYDVGTGAGRHKGAAIDTPTLVECWRTAPYLYDGRAATMVEVLRKFNAANRHGTTTNLNEAQVNDLAAYVLSL